MYAERAALGFTLVSYAGFGTPPIVGDTAPVSVSDVTLQAEHAEGRWRFSGNTTRPVFVEASNFARRS